MLDLCQTLMTVILHRLLLTHYLHRSSCLPNILPSLHDGLGLLSRELLWVHQNLLRGSIDHVNNHILVVLNGWVLHLLHHLVLL